ncbi:exonuclease domain-containing protein [Nocardiopsis sp. B62]|uniref:exonuclease domain-containing protein n=1 Tax=Nocardiopsis sp. B62 TaxID=2824874 RepID=UPI001B369519|nr:exonuclease domain-containing protein [Nocardiopsis sp. B62]MBQ1080180.1 DNA polymerase III subunit epsilon [Nocardiopsis sp. B62]
MRNRYPGTCSTCSVLVATGEGSLLRVDARWRTYCVGHEPRPVPPPRGEHPGWHTLDLLGFDTETSSPDPATAFLVSAALIDGDGHRRTWLVDPGEKEIPAGAVAVHGISTERARAEGRPAVECLREIAEALAGHLGRGGGLVVFNAPFDLTLVDAEHRRHGLGPLAEALGRPPEPIVDPLVIDRAVEPFRRGRRTLGDLCAYYGVPLTDAHTAGGDARAALALAWEIGARHAETAALTLPELHRRQVEWALEFARRRQEWLDREKPDHGTVIDGTWP